MQLFKKRKILSNRQLKRAKIVLGAVMLFAVTQFITVTASNHYYNGETYEHIFIHKYPRGRITEYTSLEEFCHSWVLFPGWSILPWQFLSVWYCLVLIWLFLGIGIIADIFMEAINHITSTKRTAYITDPLTGQLVATKIPVWNPTVANLTLMALGSSAPEILLSVIETYNTLGSTPGELGPSTIVGSAAFNFLVISAVSIWAVTEENDTRTKKELEQMGDVKGVKKVADTGVFAITTIWSVVAYVWLYYVLMDGIVAEWEAWTTLGFFFLLLIMAYVADCINRRKTKDREDQKYGIENAAVSQLTMVDFYNKLLPLEAGQEDTEEDPNLTKSMKEFLQKQFGTTKVSEVNREELRKRLEGESLIERIGYRQKVAILSKKEVIAKGAKIRRENRLASDIEDKMRHPQFGFHCLHYSVSEAAGVLRVKIINKTGNECTVGVKTIDAEAESPGDYIAVDQVIEFEQGTKEAEISIVIVDDDAWEPDEDFFVQLYDVGTKQDLKGEDTRCRVTIMDDDRPGQLVFSEKKSLKHPADAKECIVGVERIHGCDGVITVKYKTIVFDRVKNKALPDRDFTHVEGTLTFKHNETRQDIIVPILKREDEDENTVRDEIFGVKLFDADPSIVKISKKDTCIVEIVTDAERKKQAEALQQLLDRINREEHTSWGQQILNACMLHPSKNEDGEIEDVTGTDALLHFLSIGWKVIFSFCPPPHIWGGWACFIVALIFIGCVTAIVGEVATLMGCVMGIKPGVTAITFVAIGTSLPDTFASKTAAVESPSADSAVGNVTGSNSVNVFLGLGLPWVMAVVYYKRQGQEYEVPSSGLALSVVLFLACSVVGIAILVIRRCVCKGELGGSTGGRLCSAFLFVALWLIYIVVSILAQYQLGPFREKAEVTA